MKDGSKPENTYGKISVKETKGIREFCSKEKNKTYISEKVGKWLEKNRSLVLRQTPFWAQSIVGVLIGIGTLSVIAGLIFRIDEVITVTGN